VYIVLITYIRGDYKFLALLYIKGGWDFVVSIMHF